MAGYDRRRCCCCVVFFMLVAEATAAAAAAAAGDGGVNITRILESAGGLETFVSLVVATGVDGAYQRQAESRLGITVFAPTDAAFSASSSAAISGLPARLKLSLLRFHALSAFYSLSALQHSADPATPTLATDSASRFTLSVADDAASGQVLLSTPLSRAAIVSTLYNSLPASVFAVDHVLLPREIFATVPSPAPSSSSSSSSSSHSSAHNSPAPDAAAAAAAAANHHHGNSSSSSSSSSISPSPSSLPYHYPTTPGAAGSASSSRPIPITVSSSPASPFFPANLSSSASSSAAPPPPPPPSLSPLLHSNSAAPSTRILDHLVLPPLLLLLLLLHSQRFLLIMPYV